MTKKDIIIGPSTGSFYYRYHHVIYSLPEQGHIIEAAGGNCLEFNAGPEKFDKDNSRIKSWLDQNNQFTDFNPTYSSLHIRNSYDNHSSIDFEVEVIKELIKCRKIKTVVVHPQCVDGKNYPEHFFETMVGADIPLAIENLDASEQDGGYKIKELVRLVECYNLGFIFDLQHAYAHDHKMQYGRDLFEALGDKIIHYHVSGGLDIPGHVLLTKSKNKAAILDLLRDIFLKKELPVILEGEFFSLKELQAEISFIKNFLNH